MNRECLSERRLLEVAGETCTSKERAHLQACGRCAERYAALRADLALIGAALHTLPARGRAPQAAWWAAPGLAVAAAAMMLVVGVVVGGWLVRPAPVAVGRAPLSSGEFVFELSEALGAVDGDLGVAAAPDTHAVRAALSGRWPCTTVGALTTECDDELTATATSLMD